MTHKKALSMNALLIAFYLLMGPGIVWADETETAPPASSGPVVAVAVVEQPEIPEADAPAEEVSSSNSLETVMVTQPGNVTIDFKDADIQSVLRILAFKSGVNIVAGKDVVGNVTIRLVDVPWEKALDVILKTYGYSYDQQDNVIRVSTLDNLRREELSTEVFTLNYSKAAEIEKTITNMLSERGKIKSDARSNTLIVTDMPTSLQTIRTVVKRLDQQTPQVLIEARVIELTLGDADKMGFDWNFRAAINGSKRPTSFPFPAVQRTIFSSMFPYGRATQTSSLAVGSDAATTNIDDFPSGKGGAGRDAIQPTFPVADKTEFTFGMLDFNQLSTALELIKSRSDAKILSEPHVTVLNNQEAKILVGEVIAIPTFERNSTTGKMEITGYEDRDLGVRLSVLPQVNSENEIVVNIHPEITNLVGYDELTTEIKAPRFSTREARTNVRIRSGETIAIGGLIKENVVERKSKFPLLGDLPLLDKFFSYSGKETTRTDLLFFMTVTVLNDKTPLTGHKL